MRLPHKRQTAVRSVVACDSNSAGTPGQVFLSLQIILNEQRQQDLRSPAGPRRLGTATRISASLSRRLSAFFESTPDQDPKAAKYTVLIPGHAGFPKRVKQSEGRDSAPVGNAPVSACKPLCAIFLREPSVYPFSSVKANVGHLWEKLKIGMRNGWGQSCGGIFADFFSSADGEGSQRTGKCMYIKARRNQGSQMLTT